jgi:hypothetical protein
MVAVTQTILVLLLLVFALIMIASARFYHKWTMLQIHGLQRMEERQTAILNDLVKVASVASTMHTDTSDTSPTFHKIAS